jgi:pimeloyl-ACP methyl ester carboxylesterase
MGSGPSIHLCANRQPANLILISPYTSIKNVSKELLGTFMSGLLIKERFKNIDKIGEVDCPILLIHGKKDKLVPHEHSENLARSSHNSAMVKLCLNENMEHNNFNLYIEIINPIYEFFKESGYDPDTSQIIKKDALFNYGLILRYFNKLNSPEDDVCYKIL